MFKFHVRFFFADGDYFSQPFYASDRANAMHTAARYMDIYNANQTVLFPIVSFTVRKGRAS